MEILVWPRSFQRTNDASGAESEIYVEINDGATIAELIHNRDFGIVINGKIDELAKEGEVQFLVKGQFRDLSYVLEDQDKLILFPGRPPAGG